MNGTVWTVPNTNAALRLRRHGYSAKQIAVKMNTTKNAVLGKFYRLGLSQKGKDAHWSGARRAKFRVLISTGMSNSRIAKDMGMTSEAVRKRRYILGLPSYKEITKELAQSRMVTLP